MHHTTDRIAHTTAFVTPFVEHWLERDGLRGAVVKISVIMLVGFGFADLPRAGSNDSVGTATTPSSL